MKRIITACNNCLLCKWSDGVLGHYCDHPNTVGTHLKYEQGVIITPSWCPLKEESLTLVFEGQKSLRGSMDIYASPGTKVQLIIQDGKLVNGLEWEQSFTLKFLTPGETYTVRRTEVHNWRTDVILEEFPDMSFNSVMFKEV